MVRRQAHMLASVPAAVRIAADVLPLFRTTNTGCPSPNTIPVTFPTRRCPNRRCTGERPGRSRYRLQDAVLRKRGRTFKETARTVGRGISAVHRRLSGRECEGLERRHDAKSPVRPQLLDPEQENAMEGDLDGTSRECGFGRGSWNARMLARRTLGRFGVPYSNRSAIRLAHRLGFSVRKPRPIPYNGSTPEWQRGFIKKGRAAAARWRAGDRTVVAVDASTLRDSPLSRRGIRRREKGAVPVNYSKQPIHMIGALGDGALELQIHDNPAASMWISSGTCTSVAGRWAS